LYAAWVETGHMTKEDILTLRKIDSIYEGHPTPVSEKKNLRFCSLKTPREE